MAINPINTQNTFDQWVTTTQATVANINYLTDGPLFVANTQLDIAGTVSSLNVRNSGAINTLYANVANLANIAFSESNMTIPGNVARVNVTTELAVGANASITANVLIGGNVSIAYDTVVTRNVTAGNVIVTGSVISTSGYSSTSNSTFGNVSVTNTGTINKLEYTTANGQSLTVTGIATMNRASGNIISQMEEISIALSLVLG
jgi:hypothetical protein